MRILIAAVGRVRDAALRELYGEYVGRLAAGGRERWRIELVEVEEPRKLPPAELVAREAALLMKAMPKGARIVALDARGKALSSEDFAVRLGRWRDDGTVRLAFAIGGSHGLDPTVIHSADLVLSLGAMTWPHQLVRAMLVEQIYRAKSILEGHPYHRA